MQNSLAIANYFIKKSFDSGHKLTPMKLVKLVYIAHGWYLGLSNEPLLNEPVQAWQYGPVVKSVYDEFKNYGSQPITGFGYKPYNENDGPGFYLPEVKDENIKKFLDKIWDVYKEYDGIQLSTLTHQLNTPWYKVWNEMGGKVTKSAIIGNDLIKDHYKNKMSFNLTPLH